MAGEGDDVVMTTFPNEEETRVHQVIKRCRCPNPNAEEAAAAAKKMKKMVKVKERMTREEVERLLSFVPRTFPLRDRKPRCDDPEINQFEDILAHTVLLLNSNTQIILQDQARAREELRTKGYVDRWDQHRSLAQLVSINSQIDSNPTSSKNRPRSDDDDRLLKRAVLQGDAVRGEEEKEAKRMKETTAVVPEEQVEHLLSFVTMEPIPLPVVSADSDDNPNSLRNRMDRLLIRAINHVNTNSQVIRQMQANAREDLRTKGYIDTKDSPDEEAAGSGFEANGELQLTKVSEICIILSDWLFCVDPVLGGYMARHEMKRCSSSKEATPSEEKEAKRTRKEVVKKRMAMERVQHLLSMAPRAPVPLPVIRDDSPELKEIDQALTNIVQALNASSQLIRQMQANALHQLRTKGYVDSDDL
uniref:Uncharacterized protein n=1 Tax=Oryza glumipatula TaxID=40148 RepID=A0A0E0BER0_9ORYZ